MCEELEGSLRASREDLAGQRDSLEKEVGVSAQRAEAAVREARKHSQIAAEAPALAKGKAVELLGSRLEEVRVSAWRAAEGRLQEARATAEARLCAGKVEVSRTLTEWVGGLLDGAVGELTLNTAEKALGAAAAHQVCVRFLRDCGSLLLSVY